MAGSDLWSQFGRCCTYSSTTFQARFNFYEWLLMFIEGPEPGIILQVIAHLILTILRSALLPSWRRKAFSDSAHSPSDTL